MKKIRVVFGLTDFIVGGMQRQFSEQARVFDCEKYEIILITLSQHPEKAELYDALPKDLEVHKLNFKGVKDVRSWWRLYALLKILKPDIVVSSIFFANTVFRILRPLVGYISIPREHNTYVDKSKLHQLVDRILSHLSYRIATVSKSVADFTSKQEGIPLAKFAPITNGIDVVKAQAQMAQLPDKLALKKELGYGENDVVLLNMARLVRQKNHDVLIEGFKKFYGAHPEYRLAIVGAGGLQEKLQKHIHDSGLEDSVKLFGMRSDVWRFYKAADIFVSAAGIEGLSNAELEALTAGLPLVSTRTSGTDELLVEDEKGVFIEGFTACDVTDALEEMAKVSREDMGRKSLEHVKDYDIRATVDKYSKLFQNALHDYDTESHR